MNPLFKHEPDITPADEESMVVAIANAYPNRQFFYNRIFYRWGVDIGNYIALNQGGLIVADEILKWAKAKGRRLDLLALAWTDDREDNYALRSLVEKFFDDLDAVRAKYAPPDVVKNSLPIARPSLEAVVQQKSLTLNLEAFIVGLGKLSRAICRVGTPSVQGTGFLVGRRTVLTNYHVLKDAIPANVDGADIVCEFDYASTSAPTTKLHGAPGATWLGPRSPFSQSDLTGTGTPGADELDFAVIHLAKDVEPGRHALSFPESPPIVSPLDYVFIGQHPGGDEAKISFGQMVELAGNGLRYRYDATTRAGSSGSPVVGSRLELLALHHAAEPSGNPRYNQGVPIWVIMQHLRAKGVDLGAL